MSGGGDMLCWRAGSGVGKYNVESPKQGSKRVQLYYADDPLCPSRYCILFIYVVHSVNIIVYKYAHFGVSTIVSFPIFY